MSRGRQVPSAPAPQLDPKQMREKIVQGAQTIQTSAELVDAMVFSLELMIADQKRLMREEGVIRLLVDNELWSAMATMTATMRIHMHEVGRVGEDIERAGMAQERQAA
jgi:hypothetical protein